MFAHSDEQRMLAETLNGVLAHGADWTRAIEETGIAGLGTDEAAGGLGTDIRDAAVVAAAIGRAGAELPWTAHWTAACAAPDDAATLLDCAETVGLCRTMLRDAAAFARERRQFGVAIATFQALRHRMADMAMALEQAEALTGVAIDRFADDAARARAVSAARVMCADAARIVGEGAVQIHGAMGLTAELRVGGYFRRAVALMQRHGGTAAHLARYAA